VAFPVTLLSPFVGMIEEDTMAATNFAGWRPKMEVAEELKISERTL